MIDIPKYRAWSFADQEMIPVDEINFRCRQIGHHYYSDLSRYYAFDEIVLMRSPLLKGKDKEYLFEGDVVVHESYGDGIPFVLVYNKNMGGWYLYDEHGSGIQWHEQSIRDKDTLPFLKKIGHVFEDKYHELRRMSQFLNERE